MTYSKPFLTTILGALLVFSIAAPQAKATIIYSYTGGNFTSGGGPNEQNLGALPKSGDPYTSANLVTASVTLSSPLPFNNPTLTDYSSEVTAATLSDGLETISTLSNSNDAFFFGTTNGAITSWVIEIYTVSGTVGIGTITTEDFAEEGCHVLGTSTTPAQCAGNNYNEIGYITYTSRSSTAWQSTVVPDSSSTPEPASLSLMILGSLLWAGTSAITGKHRRDKLRI